jgi:hypothetical protein
MRAALLLLFAAVALAGDTPKGKYRPQAEPEVILGWEKDLRTKRPLVPPPPAPLPSTAAATDFSGSYRFGPYDYTLDILQKGDQIVLTSRGVDHQDIGGAFDTIGVGRVEKDRIRARWWCFDLTRNYANNGGAELWFEDGRIRVRYYHDADEAIEEGYGVRLGTRMSERLEYRIRVPRETKNVRASIEGSVTGFGGEKVPDALVMVRDDPKGAVRTDAEGRFRLPVARIPYVLMIAAAAPGYRNQVQAILLHDLRDVRFVLEPSPYADDPRYEFRDPTPDKGDAIWNCGNCHKNSYAEWSKSRHAVAASSEVLRAVYEKDFLRALGTGGARGDPGLCAACHAPEAALDGKIARIGEIRGPAALGNHCDLCHKTHHVERIEAPGVRGSLALGRPSPDDGRVPGPIKRVYGALPDSDYLFMGPVWNPFFGTSALCAGCHEYETPEGIPALATYTEWAKWAASRKEAESCQSCHMPVGVSMEGKSLAKRICINALRRAPERIHEHSFLGRDLLPTAVGLTATATCGDRLEVQAKITTHGVGHRVPTGSADKHLLLVVVAEDAEGRPLPLVAGERVPGHAGGEGDPLALGAADFRARLDAHDFAGLPGREFAQVLAGASGETHVPFWRAEKVVADTRLEPDSETTERFAFTPPAGTARIRVELWHRLRHKKGDVAADARGIGVRPLDQLVASVDLP